MKGWQLFFVVALTLAGCAMPVSAPINDGGQARSISVPMNSPTPRITTSATIVPTAAPTSTKKPIATASEIEKCPITIEVCDLGGHFWLGAPIKNGNTGSSDGYRFGSTQNGARETHHGVEYENPSGTVVVSAADGEVVFSGSDLNVSLAWVPNFYGNVVVVRHDLERLPVSIYTLYGHLSLISVSAGDEVNAGEKLGEVGASGTALGSHLHFEVRIEKNAYETVGNPLLWVVPEDGSGVAAGAVIGTDGNFRDAVINVQRVIGGTLNPNSVTSIVTYQQKQLPVENDLIFHENFAAGNLSPGMYRLSFLYNGKIIEKIIEVKSKRLTYVNFIVE